VVVTFRGKPCAKLVPFNKAERGSRNNEAFGMWRDHDLVEDVNGYVRILRKGRFHE
jgi:antitoxin (DNA-binding transcriptional repressor) of toxin-antitoxin stability system